jgi:hypothetical protein
MRKAAKRRWTRRITWWWAATVGVAATALVLRSGAYASRPEQLQTGTLGDLLGSREAVGSFEHAPTDPEVWRIRHQMLRQRREEIDLRLPKRLEAPRVDHSTYPPANAPALPPRIDSGDPNPDRLHLQPSR